MSFTNHTISVHYARAVANTATRNGLDVDELLNHAQLTPAKIKRDVMRITPQQLSELVKAYGRMADDELLGLATGRCRRGIFALMAEQAVHRKTMAGIYRYICRFYGLITQAFTLQFEELEQHATLTMTLADASLDQDHLLHDLYLLIWHRFPAWLIGTQVTLKAVHFTFPRPAHADEYRLLFPCPVKFNQPLDQIIIDNQFLDKPVVQTPETLANLLEEAPLNWFKRQNYWPRYTRIVLDQLTEKTEFNNLQIEDIASGLNMTSRTLRRKLDEENTTFQALKQSARREMAMHMLARGDQSVFQIALALGYSDTAAFSRAFKSWTGVTPNHYK